MELVIILICSIIVFFMYKKIEKVIYFIVFMDVLLRLVAYIKQNITIQEVYTFLNRYIPLSIPSLIDKYTTGIFNEVLIWIYVGIFIVFEYFIIRLFFKKK